MDLFRGSFVVESDIRACVFDSAGSPEVRDDFCFVGDTVYMYTDPIYRLICFRRLKDRGAEAIREIENDLFDRNSSFFVYFATGIFRLFPFGAMRRDVFHFKLNGEM